MLNSSRLINIFSKYYQKDLNKLFSQLVPSGHGVAKNYILLPPNSLAYVEDVQQFIQEIRKKSHENTRIVVVYFSFLWKPILNVATNLGLRKKELREPNWISSQDMENFFCLEGFEKIKQGRRLLLPLGLGIFSTVINKYFAQLPLINNLCLTNYQILKPIGRHHNYSVSVIIPARNEEGNIKGILGKIPHMGKKVEVIFIEGHSKDETYQAIKAEIARHPKIKTKLFKQRGIGKADAVKLGFDKAKNELLMILDADLTVNPKDLLKFYNAIASGYTNFANGVRLVYPMENQAMRTLNYLGNVFFSYCFSYLLGQRLKDTLCGTKALLKKDYIEIKRNRKFFGDFDPFGDYDLLFGAAKLNLKITDIPVRYHERSWGTTNISRFLHGWLLLKMVIFAARKIKFT